MCGCAITPEKKKKKYVYYHCTQYNGKHENAEWLREEEITKQLGDSFRRLQVPREVVEDILDSLKELHGNKEEFRIKQAEKLSKEKEKYSKRIATLLEMRMDESITKGTNLNKVSSYWGLMV